MSRSRSVQETHPDELAGDEGVARMLQVAEGSCLESHGQVRRRWGSLVWVAVKELSVKIAIVESSVT